MISFIYFFLRVTLLVLGQTVARAPAFGEGGCRGHGADDRYSRICGDKHRGVQECRKCDSVRVCSHDNGNRGLCQLRGLGIWLCCCDIFLSVVLLLHYRERFLVAFVCVCLVVAMLCVCCPSVYFPSESIFCIVFPGIETPSILAHLIFPSIPEALISSCPAAVLIFCSLTRVCGCWQ